MDSHSTHSAPVRDGLRAALQLSDQVARLGPYALTNQSRAEHAAQQVVHAFETISAYRAADASLRAVCVDALMRLKKLLSTPSTVRTVPGHAHDSILGDLATLEHHVAGLIRGHQEPLDHRGRRRS
ncbi:MAG: hypothetical protein M0R74_08045 [Dehalococcoidia bacterium]|nr:hypothetical protein [Dehalococcoidia bacterium]